MKNSTVRITSALFFASALFVSCGKNNQGGADDSGSVETEEVTTTATQTATPEDTANAKKVDATRMSNGKDSVDGEVTPPNATKQ